MISMADRRAPEPDERQVREDGSSQRGPDAPPRLFRPGNGPARVLIRRGTYSRCRLFLFLVRRVRRGAPPASPGAFPLLGLVCFHSIGFVKWGGIRYITKGMDVKGGVVAKFQILLSLNK